MKKICILNAPEDHTKASTCKKHMAMLRINGLIEFTDDVASAQIVMVLLSNDILVHDGTMARSEEAKRRFRSGACRLLPVLVEEMAELPDHLATLVALPRHGKPARTDSDWASVAAEVRAICMKDVT